MQVTTESKFKKTKVSLGTSKKTHIISPKAKYQNAGFCPYCYKTVHLGADNQCLVCGTKIQKNEKTFEILCHRFDKIIEINKDAFENYTPNGFDFKIPIQIKSIGYHVPIRIFLEYQNIKYSDDKDYNIFFEYVKKSCVV